MKKLLSLLLFTPLIASAQFGVLDANFDADGILSIDINGQTELAYGVAEAPDGKILFCGYTASIENDIFIVRVNPDGSPDNSFGTNGMEMIDYSVNDKAYSISVLDNGKILLGGTNQGPNGTDFAIIRLLSDGTLDATFGNNGLVTIEITTSTDLLYDMDIQPDGKIVAIGTVASANDIDAVVIRLNSDGSLDNSFSFDGKVVTSIADDDIMRAMAFGPNGTIIVAGNSQGGIANNEAVLVRYNSDGSLDNTFGSNGIVSEDIGSGDDELFDLVVDSEGSITACGRSGSGIASDMLVAKFNPDGTLDNSFSFDGIVKVDFDGDYDLASSIVIQPDSRILIAGAASDAIVAHALARLNADGTLDDSFGTNGKVRTSIGSTGFIQSAIIQSDLKVLTCGYANEASYNAIVARYTSGMNVGIGDVDAYIGSTLIYPNPTSEQLTVEYELKSSQKVAIELLDISGKRVALLQPEIETPAGEQVKVFNLPALNNGNYVLQLATPTGKVRVLLTSTN